ncbi:type-1 angiotensin II receptor-associated protein isoform X2 [Nematostella vectensis]|uniref:type-1 angiotensin II receptor-associated protein isoform X2 n=1 Tax=Nematostella vectensis TaxID=45351 RepID=UPI00138FF52A|nr:type-1 angiotensin II receptor-associated protein isoform X2 [Nematostella vectensis]
MQRVSVTMPSVSIKVIIGVHFILTTWATLYPTLPTSYVFSNFLVLFMGIWALVETERTDPVVMFLLGLIFTIISDIVALSIYYVNLDNSTYRFAIGMAIMSLILKPLSCICIFLDFRNRGGEVDTRWAENPYVTIEGHNDIKGASGPQA